MTAAAASASFGPAARSSAVSSVLIYGCLVLGAVFALLPISWGVSTSLKSVIDVNAHPSRWIPEEITTSNWSIAVANAKYARYLTNTFIVIGFTLIVSLGLAAHAAHATIRQPSPAAP